MTQQANKLFSHLNIVVIGCGNWGKNHIRVLHELGALYGISDIDPQAARQQSQTYHVPILNLDQILKDPKVNGVLIATPASSHFTIAKACLLTGIHTFVEKPVSLCPKEAKNLSDLAQEKQTILMVGHLLQYHAAFAKLKQLKENGVLGKLQYLYSNRLNLGKFRTEEDVWWSFAPHDVSMILSLVGEMPDTVLANGAKYLQHTFSDINSAHLTFPGGQQAHIFVSWLHPYKEQKLVVIGEKAMAIFDDGKAWDSKLQLHPYPADWQDGLPHPSKTQAQNIPIDPSEPLKMEDIHFLNCIDKNMTPLTDGEEAYRVLAILTAAECSIAQCKIIHLKEFVDNPAYFMPPLSMNG